MGWRCSTPTLRWETFPSTTRTPSGDGTVLMPRIVGPDNPVAGALLTAEHGLIMRDTADGPTTRTTH